MSRSFRFFGLSDQKWKNQLSHLFIFCIKKIRILPENDSWCFRFLVTLTKNEKQKMEWTRHIWWARYWQKISNCFDLIIFFISSNYFPKTVASTYNRKYESPTFQEGLAQSFLIYDPRCREQIWRFFTYMFLHGDPIHLGFNLALQLLVGKSLW